MMDDEVALEEEEEEEEEEERREGKCWRDGPRSYRSAVRSRQHRTLGGVTFDR